MKERDRRMATEELTCERDSAPTRLTCCQCGTPICPQCFVRTPVGLKCMTCGVRSGGSAARRRPPWLAPVVVLAVLAAVIALPRLLSSDEASDDEGASLPANAAVGPARFALLGEEARDGDLAFVATAFDCGATEVGGAGASRTAQGRFCFLTLTLRNTGRAPVQFASNRQSLVDGQTRRFGFDERATAAHPANAGRDMGSPLINPSNELHGVLVFDVPPDVNPEIANLRAGPRGAGATIRLVARQ